MKYELFENSKWINSKQALELTKKYQKGPHTEASLVWAGKKGNFIKKDTDGCHWLFHKDILNRYCEIANEMTLLDLAKHLNTNIGALKYLSLKNGIEFEIELGRKYLSPESIRKLKELYTGGE